MKLFLQTKNGADGLPMIGAMAELGLDMTALADVLASSGLPCHIETQKVTRGGLQGTAVGIQPRSMEAMDFQASRDIFERAPVEDTVRRGRYRKSEPSSQRFQRWFTARRNCGSPSMRFLRDC